MSLRDFPLQYDMSGGSVKIFVVVDSYGVPFPHKYNPFKLGKAG